MAINNTMTIEEGFSSTNTIEDRNQTLGELRAAQNDIQRYLEAHGYKQGAKSIAQQLKTESVAEVQNTWAEKGSYTIHGSTHRAY